MAELLNENAWIDIIDSWRKSGLGQAEFCKKNKIKTSAFYYWRRKIDRIKKKSKKAGGNSPVAKKTKKATPEFIEVPVSEALKSHESKPQSVRFTTSYGAMIEFPL